MSKTKTNYFEIQLLATRQAKQIMVSILLGLMTIVFLDSIYVLSAVMHSIETSEIFFFFLLFTIYAVAGAFALGILARYAFIRHLKRVEADLHRIHMKRLSKTRSLYAITPSHVPVHPHGMSYAPSRPRLRA